MTEYIQETCLGGISDFSMKAQCSISVIDKKRNLCQNDLESTDWNNVCCYKVGD